MSDPTPEPTTGDPCPQCGGAFKAARVPTDEQRKAVEDRDSLSAYPPNTDTAPAAFVEKRGLLHTCRDCGYQTRIKPAPDAKPAPEPAGVQADAPAGAAGPAAPAPATPKRVRSRAKRPATATTGE